ncbi:exodeoxyribonuclease V, gamma subunit [Acinetobacter nectaris CIP 110549]|uniref:RecBCD enzyme subunit RecC n=2 Tax=Acinetobacter nectaris CIP 110549 TaxID=1392540 RepID=V2TRN8_9GAMM|nr:exodeoxyribonuclease V subunit gamma [Acinetobacter nectaris]ESK38720.1 exodeoxyribonuclease V, gamma subunit [Acinetobacter nectaris CIP 110549]
MGIHVFQSQQLEVLAQMLLEQQSKVTNDPFRVLETQHFIVPNQAIEQWLKQYIAEQQGISANQIYHQRIQTFQWYVYQQVMTDKDQVRQANIPRLVMKWRIYEALRPFIASAQVELSEQHALFDLITRIYESAIHLTDPLQRQIKKQSMLYWVSEQVSCLFGHYMLYRGYCLEGHVEGKCSCKQNWLDAWGRDQAIDIEKLISPQSKNLSLYNLEQAESLEAWQRWLWHEVFHDDFLKIKTIDAQFWQILEATKITALKHLPQQVTIFTLLDLPPNQLQFLRRLGQYIDVTIYHYNPSQEYWADSVDPQWKKTYDAQAIQRFREKNERLKKKLTDEDIEAFIQTFNVTFNAEARESRHPLLTRFGKQARDHFSLLAGLSSGEEGIWEDLFFDDYQDTLLGKIQSDILFLMEPEAQVYPLAKDDYSIQVHVCHSNLRQLEVLKGQLIYWLSQGTKEAPRRLDDILVVAPDLTTLEPMIRSVFAPPPRSQGQRQESYLPIKIVGVPQFDLTNAWLAVIGRIQLPQGRFKYSDFADWLSLLPTQRYYGLDYEQVTRMLTLLEKAGFKRGLDEAHLKRFLLEEDQDYRFSFKFALDRLAMGVAVPEHTIVRDILSYAEVQPEDFPLIGCLIQIYNDLDHRRDWLICHEQGQHYSVEYWLTVLADEIALFQQQGEDILRTVAELINKHIRMLTLSVTYEKRNQQEKMGQLDDLTLPLAYVISEIEQGLESQLENAEPSGHITFSEIGQIRPIPYQLTVVLGLDSGVFPSRNRHIPFDLMQVLQPILGDRSRLEDDQGAFLDALLLAKDNFWLFYNGFDEKSDELMQPSSVLQEFIDHLAFITQENKNIEVTQEKSKHLEKMNVPIQLASIYHIHALQPFDAVNFIDLEKGHYQDQWFAVAQQLQHHSGKRQPWVDQAYQLNVTDIMMLDAYQWVKDVTFPAQLYLRALGVENIKKVAENSDEEPLFLDGLAKYKVRDFLQSQQALTHNADMLLDQLPVGKTQQSAWQQSQQEYLTLLERLHTYADKPTETTQQTLCISEYVYLRITVPKQASETQWVVLRLSSSQPERRAQEWLNYLLWLQYLDLDEQSQDYRYIVVFSDQTMIYEGVSSAKACTLLKDWWALWQQAMVTPIVLPAQLLLSLSKKNKQPEWTEEKSLDKKTWQTLSKHWNDPQKHNKAISADEDKASKYHQEWQFILQEQDANALLEKHCREWAYRLYAPIYEHLNTIG